MLEIKDLSVNYAALRAVNSANLKIEKGKILALEGHHGAGKTSLLKAIVGAVGSVGEVSVDGLTLMNRNAASMLALGVVFVPEGRHLFASLSSRDNLKFGAAVCGVAENFDRVLALFPELIPMLDKPAFALSGGQAQMLAFARGLMASPDYLLLDEPLMGLATSSAKRICSVALKLRAEGIGILITGQHTISKQNIATDYIIIENGVIKWRKEDAK